MSLEIRVPEETEREAVGDVLQVSLNLDPARRASRLPRMPLEDFRVAVDGGRIVSTAAEYRFRQWFGGRAIPMSGVFGVATLPEYRGAGAMREAVTAVMRDAHARATPITALYPAVIPPYRSLGYELGGSYHEHRIRIAAIPADVGNAGLVREYRPDDLPAVRECWHRWVRDANGTTEPTGDGWWTNRTFNERTDPTLRAVVVPGERGAVEAFASFRRSATAGVLDIAFGLECEPMAAVTERGVRALFAYFRGYRGIGEWVQWAGAPQNPYALLLPDHAVASEWRFPWMLRLLRLEDALRARGWPAGADAEAVVAVEDPLFPDNTGTWRVAVRGGEADVRRDDAAPGARPVSINALSSMFAGYLRPRDAVRIGLMDGDDPAVDALAAMFAGSDPWTGLFF